ncbi:hypothetical protein M569_06838 [Genlisea aurea]|uniref:SHSP domain-containing protein n=1 Tax=Genlisea aurea TaxID=192259 RepID=S8CMJ5_9LAMI|nr:hypothetical protein M569_06838 [Genlisea aurea]
MSMIRLYGGGDDFLGSIRYDRKVTASDYVLTVDVPGMRKEGLTAEIIMGRFVNLVWESEDCDKCFDILIYVPEKAKLDEVTVVMGDGVITITVPRSEGKEPEVEDKVIEIWDLL